MTDVRLTWSELRWGGHAGIDRTCRALSGNYRQVNGASEGTWQDDILGAWGELVVAKDLGHYWCGDRGRPDSGLPDVGPYHVRTRREQWQDMYFLDSDKDTEPYVCVTVLQLPLFRIDGWCWGKEGKRDEYWQTKTGRPCYFMPKADLRPWPP